MILILTSILIELFLTIISNFSMEIDTLQKTNSSLKASIQATTLQFQSIFAEIQAINNDRPAKKREDIQAYVQIVKNYNIISKELPKVNKILEDIGIELLNRQVKKNDSDQFRKIIKLLETKISELRAQIHVKQVNFLQAKQYQTTPLSFSDEYQVPKNYQFRKLHIEHLHRQKIDKLLKLISSLQSGETDKQVRKQGGQILKSECKGTIEKLRSFQKYVVENMQLEIDKQEKRSKELNEKLQVYRKIYEVVCEENREVKKKLIKNKQS